MPLGSHNDWWHQMIHPYWWNELCTLNTSVCPSVNNCLVRSTKVKSNMNIWLQMSKILIGVSLSFSHHKGWSMLVKKRSFSPIRCDEQIERDQEINFFGTIPIYKCAHGNWLDNIKILTVKPCNTYKIILD